MRLREVYSTFVGLGKWRWRYYYLISIRRMYCYVVRYNLLKMIGRPPKGYDSKIDGHVVGHWLDKYPLKPASMMVLHSDDQPVEELTLEVIYRDTPKKPQDGIVLVVNPKQKAFALRVGSNMQGVVSKETQMMVQEKVAPFFERNEILGGIQEGMRLISQMARHPRP